MNKIKCSNCGCKRSLMLRGLSVVDQSNSVKYGMRSICIPCLLKMAKCDVRKEDELILYQTVREEERCKYSNTSING